MCRQPSIGSEGKLRQGREGREATSRAAKGREGKGAKGAAGQGREGGVSKEVGRDGKGRHRTGSRGAEGRGGEGTASQALCTSLIFASFSSCVHYSSCPSYWPSKTFVTTSRNGGAVALRRLPTAIGFWRVFLSDRRGAVARWRPPASPRRTATVTRNLLEALTVGPFDRPFFFFDVRPSARLSARPSDRPFL